MYSDIISVGTIKALQKKNTGLNSGPRTRMQGHGGNWQPSEGESFWSLREFAGKYRRSNIQDLPHKGHLEENLPRNGSLFCLVTRREEQPGFSGSLRPGFLPVAVAIPVGMVTSDPSSKETLEKIDGS